MEHTATYGLTQWSKSDRIQMEDFNSDNLKLEQALTDLTAQTAKSGNCKIVVGTYTGTGTYGSSGPCTLTFDGKPIVVFVGSDGFQFTASRGASRAIAAADSQNDRTQHLTWGETTLSWYSLSGNAAYQLNYSGAVYHYVALLADI